MPIALDITAKINEASVTDTANQAKDLFADAGRDTGDEYGRAIAQGIIRSGPVIRKGMKDLAELNRRYLAWVNESKQVVRAHDEVTRAVQRQGEAAQQTVGSAGALSHALIGLTSGALKGAEWERGARAVENFGEKLNGISPKAAGAAAGVTAVIAAVAVATKGLYELGERWDSIGDAITLRTGAMGKELQGLKDSVRDIGANTAAPLEDIGDVVAQVHQTMGLQGAELERMSKNLVELSEFPGGQVNIRNFSKALKVFGVDVRNQGVEALNQLAEASRATGIPVEQLVFSIQRAGKATRQFGLDFGQTAGLLVNLEQAGLDMNRALPALSIALRKLDSEGRGTADGLRDLITEIKNTGSAAEAQKYFGRGYIDFFNAIRDGRLDLDDLRKSLEGDGKSIEEVKESTEDWHESWQKLKNTLSGIFEPAAREFFDFLNGSIQSAIDGTMQFGHVLANLPIGNIQFPMGASGPLPPGYNPGPIFAGPYGFQPGNAPGNLAATNPLAPALGNLPDPANRKPLKPNGIGNAAAAFTDRGLAPVGSGWIHPGVFPINEDAGKSGRRGEFKPSEVDLSQLTPPSFLGFPDLTTTSFDAMAGGPTATIGGGTVPGLQDTGSVPSSPQSQLAAALVQQRFGAFLRGPISGSRDTNTAKGTHDAGLSIDIPIGPDQMALGDQINAFLQSMAGPLGLKYTIWRNLGRNVDGSTFNQPGHMNHIDAHFNGQGVSPFAMSGMTGMGMGGGFQIDPVEIQQKTNALLTAQEGWKEAKLRLLNMEEEGNHTQLELLTAKDDVLQKERQIQQAEIDLAEARQGKWKKWDEEAKTAGSAMDSIGAQLDADFGLSKGLSGVAENLVKFLANLAFAPAIGALSAVKAMSPIQGGSGLLGALGAQNIAAGKTPLGFGSLGGGLPGISAMGPAAFGGGMGDPFAMMGSAINGTGSQADNARLVYSMALQRGYPPQDALAITAYALGESGLNPSSSGGAQGGSGFEHEVRGLFQEKPGFAAQGGIDPSMRDNPVANAYAYLNNLEANRHLPIHQALLETSKGGPMYTGGEAAMHGLESRAASLLGMGWGNMGIPGPGNFIGGSGESPLLSLPGPGVGAGAGMGIQGRAPGQGFPAPGGGGFGGLGGLPLGALKGAASGLDLLAPGSSQLAQMGIDLLNRTAAFAGQGAGIGVEGFWQTVLPNGSALGDPTRNWLMRIAGGFAGARPALPNLAGSQPAPGTSNQNQPGSGGGPMPGQGGQQPLIGQLNYTGSAKDGQAFARDVNRQVNSHGAGMGW